MSRSNPTENNSHPATKWFEWSGGDGAIRYYDKAEKRNIGYGDKFTFILLDQLSTIKGWHDSSQSSIYSNEVKDTRAQPFVVKSFKGGVISEGLYANIKFNVAAAGGKFTTNLYIAYRDGSGPLQIGSLQFSGAALKEWMEFAKQNRNEIYRKGIQIDGSKEGRKGSVVFKTPLFKLRDISEETNGQAAALDQHLQGFLTTYLKRTTAENAQRPVHSQEPPEEPPIDHTPAPEPPEDDIPW